MKTSWFKRFFRKEKYINNDPRLIKLLPFEDRCHNVKITLTKNDKCNCAVLWIGPCSLTFDLSDGQLIGNGTETPELGRVSQEDYDNFKTWNKQLGS